jgi:hypothetical protein
MQEYSNKSYRVALEMLANTGLLHNAGDARHSSNYYDSKNAAKINALVPDELKKEIDFKLVFHAKPSLYQISVNGLLFSRALLKIFAEKGRVFDIEPDEAAIAKGNALIESIMNNTKSKKPPSDATPDSRHSR